MYSIFEKITLFFVLGFVAAYLIIKFKRVVSRFSTKNAKNAQDKSEKECPHCG